MIIDQFPPPEHETLDFHAERFTRIRAGKGSHIQNCRMHATCVSVEVAVNRADNDTGMLWLRFMKPYEVFAIE
jgi:hypothetical protein